MLNWSSHEFEVNVGLPVGVGQEFPPSREPLRSPTELATFTRPSERSSGIVHMFIIPVAVETVAQAKGGPQPFSQIQVQNVARQL